MRGARVGWAVVVAAVCAVPLAPPANGADVGNCDGEARTASLRQDEKRMLARLGTLTVLRGPEDIAALAGLGYAIPMHMLNSFENIGTSIGRADAILDQQVHSGNPGVLVYRANQKVPYTGDPYRAAFPYDLIGWAHGIMYTPGALPTSPDLCVSQLDWFIHEQGVHALPDWGFKPQPPPEHYRGEEMGDMLPLPTAALGPTHGRFWNIHVWRDPTGGPPIISVQYPFGYIAGLPTKPNTTFFYPEHLPTTHHH
ncbi:hypothetical protein [Nocardia sp. NPDC052566]|uniref:hypothetical protein n=1 Tax=Nocardia sp. NPDC052566 TaxID=3364330 RepID=UPI0037C8B021